MVSLDYHHQINIVEILDLTFKIFNGNTKPYKIGKSVQNLGKTEEVFSHYHDEFLAGWEKLGISFDLFTSTHTRNHFKVAQDMFMRLYDKGFIYKGTMIQPFCEKDNRYLADRYVLGTCPHCGDGAARGDQCDKCGRTLDAKDLVGIKCITCDESPIFRETEHFFLKLSHFEDQLKDCIETKGDWRPNVRNFTKSYLESGLTFILKQILLHVIWTVCGPTLNE